MCSYAYINVRHQDKLPFTTNCRMTVCGRLRKYGGIGFSVFCHMTRSGKNWQFVFDVCIHPNCHILARGLFFWCSFMVEATRWNRAAAFVNSLVVVYIRMLNVVFWPKVWVRLARRERPLLRHLRPSPENREGLLLANSCRSEDPHQRVFLSLGTAGSGRWQSFSGRLY